MFELRPDLWHCAGCGTAYAVGLTCCPQCSSTLRVTDIDQKTPPPAGVLIEEEPEGM